MKTRITHRVTALLLTALLGSALYGIRADAATIGVQLQEDPTQPEIVTEFGTQNTYRLKVQNTGDVTEYVRIHLTQETEGEETAVTVSPTEGDWVLRGGYYYYKPAVAPGETTAEFAIVSSVDAGADYRSALNLKAYAEAVDKDEIRDPDYTDEEPWQDREHSHHSSSSDEDDTAPATSEIRQEASNTVNETQITKVTEQVTASQSTQSAMQTGDESQMALYVVLMAAAALCFAWFGIFRRHREEDR